MGLAGYGAGNRKLWRCNHCGVVRPWDAGSRAFTSLAEEETLDHSGLMTFCSDRCAEAWETSGRPGLRDLRFRFTPGGAVLVGGAP